MEKKINKKIAPCKNLTRSHIRLHKPHAISDQNGQNLFPISDHKGSKTIPFGAAHTNIAYIREYPPRAQTSPYFRPKWSNSMSYFRPKRLKNHTLWRHTYQYSLYKGVPPGTQTSPYFRPKWSKSMSYFRPKRLKNHTLWRRTYLYSLCKGVPPSPGCAINFLCGIKLLSFVCFPVNCFIHPNPPRLTFQVIKC